MKLLHRTSLMYVLITLVVFSAGSFLFYYFLRDLEDEETTEALEEKRSLITEYVLGDSLPVNSPLAEDVSIEPGTSSFQTYMNDTTLYDPYNKEELPYRVLHYAVMNHGRWYAVSIRKQLLESDDLIEGVFYSFITVLVILGVVVILFLQFAAKRMWQPFIVSVDQLRKFKPGEKTKLILPSTNIREFKELNDAIEKMNANTEASFRSLKSFSENAAHEIQTPLAVIQAMVEVLRQDTNLTEDQHKTLGLLATSSVKLSNIVSALLLLTRIENKQFRQDVPINFSETVQEKTDLVRELFEQRGIQLAVNIAKDVQLKLHPVLADLLAMNLIVNAIRHTPENGTASITLSTHQLAVCNSGNPLKGDPKRLFERFYKEDQSETSTGLGLSIVKMVTDTYNLRVKYEYTNRNHVFSVNF